MQYRKIKVQCSAVIKFLSKIIAPQKSKGLWDVSLWVPNMIYVLPLHLDSCEQSCAIINHATRLICTKWISMITFLNQILFYDLMIPRLLISHAEFLNKPELSLGLHINKFFVLFSHLFPCEAFVSRFRHWVSEVFTSGDVSLSNIVKFLGCKSFETGQILLKMT